MYTMASKVDFLMKPVILRLISRYEIYVTCLTAVFLILLKALTQVKIV